MPFAPTSDERLREQLARHEALRYKAYDDATGAELKPGDRLVGKLTIGVGRNLSDVGLSEPEIEFLLERDIDAARAALVRNLPCFTAMDEVRKSVLINMCFNLGWPRLSGFKQTLAHVANGEYGKAATEMLNSTWADQVGPRAIELSDMMRDGIWRS